MTRLTRLPLTIYVYWGTIYPNICVQQAIPHHSGRLNLHMVLHIVIVAKCVPETQPVCPTKWDLIPFLNSTCETREQSQCPYGSSPSFWGCIWGMHFCCLQEFSGDCPIFGSKWLKIANQTWIKSKAKSKTWKCISHFLDLKNTA